MATFQATSVTAVSPGILRVVFDDIPFSAFAQREYDGLYKQNYVLSGPGSVSVDRVNTVSGNPYALDLVFTEKLIPGTWQLAISGNIETPAGKTLEPVSLDLTITQNQQYLAQNGKTFTGEDAVKQNLNPKFGGTGWKSFAAALGFSDEKINQLAKSAFFQNFFSTAAGLYLERLTTSISVDRSPNTGLSDDSLRKLAIAINSNRLINRAYLEVLRAYYGDESTTAWFKTELTGPFTLTTGDTLSLIINRTPVTVTFQSNDFTDITQASATEVSQVINRAFLANGIVASSKPTVDPATGDETVEILSGWLGLSGSLLVAGGSAASKLKFPKLIDTTAATGTQWKVMTHTSDPTVVDYGKVWLLWTGVGTDPQIQDVYENDFAVIYDTAFSSVNRGSFTITSVGVYLGSKYVEFENTSAVAQATVNQAADETVIFLDDSTTTLSKISNYYATATQPWSNQVDVLLPATAAAIERTEKTAWYANGESSVAILPYDAVRTNDGLIEIGFDSEHDLLAGDEIELTGFKPLDDRDGYFATSTNISVSYPTPFALYPSVKLADGRIFIRRLDNWVIYDPSTDSWSEYSDPSLQDRYGAAAILLQNGRVLIVGGQQTATLGYSTSEIYDPETNTIVPAGNPIDAYFATYPKLAMRSNGQVALVGGGTFGAALEFFDPDTNLWTASSLITPGTLIAPEIVVDPDDNLWIRDVNDLIHVNLVGAGDVKTFTDATYRIRGQMLFVPKKTGQIWYFGGYDNAPAALDEISVFDFSTKTFSTIPLNYARAFGNLRHLINGKYLLINGTTLPEAGMPFGLTNGPPPEMIDIFASTDTLKVRSMANELSFNYESLPPTEVLDDGRVFVASATQPLYHLLNVFQQTSHGHMNGFCRVLSVPTSTSIEIQSNVDWQTTWSEGYVTKTAAENGELQSGYALDPTSGVTIDDNQTPLTTAIVPGPAPSTISVGTVNIEDAPGYLVLDFGYEDESPPIRYLGTAGPNTIRLDPGYTFNRGYPINTNVSLLLSKTPYAPTSTLNTGVAYLTASSAGRIAASADIDDIKAVGVLVNKTVLYPGDRGLGGEGLPGEGAQKLSDKVEVWGGDNLTDELQAAREGDGGV